MSGRAQAAVVLRKVSKDYVTDWRGGRRSALTEVDLEVGAGTICALVGPNGSGKTTLLKIAAGLTVPSGGACEVRGRVGYAPDDLQLPDHATPRSALTQLARVTGIDPIGIAHLLSQVGLDAEADRKMAELSKGQRQRVALATALVGEPTILLLDEPAAALDPIAIRELAAVLRQRRAAGTTVVLSSHFLRHTEDLADRFAVLDRGRVIWTGDRAELDARGGLDAVYMEALGR